MEPDDPWSRKIAWITLSWEVGELNMCEVSTRCKQQLTAGPHREMLQRSGCSTQQSSEAEADEWAASLVHGRMWSVPATVLRGEGDRPSGALNSASCGTLVRGSR